MGRMARTLSKTTRPRGGRRSGRGLARLVGAIGLAMAAGGLVVALATERPGGTALGPPLGGDYGQFYAVGQILNESGIGRLYDLVLQDGILHRAVRSLP